MEGHNYKTAALELGVSVNTISFHMRHLYDKLQVHSKSEAVAKALRNRLEIVYPWTRPSRIVSSALPWGEHVSLIVLCVLLGATVGGAAVLVRRNLRAGRGDRRGAFRLASFVFATRLAAWFCGESHVADLWEVALED